MADWNETVAAYEAKILAYEKEIAGLYTAHRVGALMILAFVAGVIFGLVL